MSFLRRVAGRSLRDRVRSSVTREELGVEPLLLRLHREESAEVAWASVSDAPWTRLPREVFQAGMSHREEASGKTQDTLEKLCLSAGLGRAGNASGSSPRKSWRKCLGLPKQVVKDSTAGPECLLLGC
ncbi:hypothetical protein L3Q82_007287 [Scortum barcoo]|uniref:Uncharacterized protein n=1 Tax=Scortum barcoo TaxID=214431 RepID=A0ACB8WSI3_9TELE|nr:hypothetical protein L3Q82_007287 [Scortum barcoo]